MEIILKNLQTEQPPVVKSNLSRRIITGAGLVITIGVAVIAGAYSFFALVLLINCLSVLEFYRLFRLNSLFLPRKIAGTVLSVAIYAVTVLIISGIANINLLLVILPVGFFIFIAELYLHADYPFQNIAITFLGIICITIPLSLFTALPFLTTADRHYHYPVVLGYFFILWINDTGAYFFGKMFGKHKLFERISPNKTWEGSAAGIISALLVAGLNSVILPGIKFTTWGVIAAIVVVAGTWGDLIKSMMKRSLHIKDSGTILPGHGGMIDRFDTLLGSAPFVFIYLWLLPDA